MNRIEPQSQLFDVSSYDGDDDDPICDDGSDEDSDDEVFYGDGGQSLTPKEGFDYKILIVGSSTRVSYLLLFSPLCGMVIFC